MLGDLNKIIDPNKKRGGSERLEKQMSEFRDLIFDCASKGFRLLRANVYMMQ